MAPQTLNEVLNNIIHNDREMHKFLSLQNKEGALNNPPNLNIVEEEMSALSLESLLPEEDEFEHANINVENNADFW